jgi:hypothetical protein
LYRRYRFPLLFQRVLRSVNLWFRSRPQLFLKPEAQQRCVEDSDKASRRAQKGENADLGREVPLLSTR